MSRGANQRPPLLDLQPQFKLMFEPNPDIAYRPPIIKRKMPPLSGLAKFLSPDLFETTPPPVPVKTLLPIEAKDLQKEQQLRTHADILEAKAAAEFHPNDNVKATG